MQYGFRFEIVSTLRPIFTIVFHFTLLLSRTYETSFGFRFDSCSFCGIEKLFSHVSLICSYGGFDCEEWR